MEQFNNSEFELISFELVLYDSVGYPGMTSTVSQMSQWQETVSRFGEMHCKKLERLEIIGTENIFPVKSFLRSVCSVHYLGIKRMAHVIWFGLLIPKK